MKHPSIPRRLILTVILTAIMIAAVGASALAWKNRGRIRLWWEGLMRETVELSVVTVQTESVSLEALSDDPRITLDQSLLLINTEHMLSEDFTPDLAEYKTSGVRMNACILDAYAALSAAVTEQTGEKLYVSSAVRTRDEQAALYAEDPSTATLPGASEHESGLCLDVYVAYYAGDGFLQSDAGVFVNQSCADYGFIIRYPAWGEKETGIRYEPWHIRYVGQPHAKIMTANRLTLEEYIKGLEIGVCYRVDDALILRQKPTDGKIVIPLDGKAVTVSPDNTGCYIVTVTGLTP